MQGVSGWADGDTGVSTGKSTDLSFFFFIPCPEVSNPFDCKILLLFVIHLKIYSKPVEPAEQGGSKRGHRNSGICHQLLSGLWTTGPSFVLRKIRELEKLICLKSLSAPSLARVACLLSTNLRNLPEK